MDHEHINIIIDSFKEIEKDPCTFSDTLFERLFYLEPNTQDLFKTETNVFRQRFMISLGTFIRKLDKPEEFDASVSKLGLRHQAYGVLPEHYIAFGKAFIMALKSFFKEMYSPKLLEAWGEWFYETSQLMLAASYN